MAYKFREMTKLTWQHSLQLVSYSWLCSPIKVQPASSTVHVNTGKCPRPDLKI